MRKLILLLALVSALVLIGCGSSHTVTFHDIQKMPGWQDCDECAGANGHGPDTPHSMGVSLIGVDPGEQGALFSVSGHAPYGAALWWKQLGPYPWAHKLAYDFWVNSDLNFQALEFDVNQSVDGSKYIFGTQCDRIGEGKWDVWNPAAAQWMPTKYACDAINPGWHHYVWHFERTGKRVHYISLEFDGLDWPVDIYANAIPVDAQELNVAVQLDEDAAPHPFSATVDKITLTAE
jgi:hypothetical protein